ncbi:MAG: transcriptional regulator [Treponema sp.]|nr:transcriptional regulator [Treponema sp.]
MATTLADTEVEQEFNKAFNKALIHEIQHMLNPEEASLISFSDIKQLLKPKNESYEGIKTVPLKSIVGSEDRYKDFDSEFFPKNLHLKARWESIDKAHHNNVILPPISLYELGGLYFVRDGNHRVSVAKSQGIEFIDADVVSLKSEIRLKPGKSLQYMRKQVLSYEKRTFYAETAYGDITNDWCLDFSKPGQYDVIYNHIITHKYFINQSIATEISIVDAILSWYNTVYMPILSIIDKKHLMRKFHHNTKSDLYVWIIKYWDDLKKKFGSDYSLEAVAENFTKQYGTTLSQKIKNTIKHILIKHTFKVNSSLP